MAASDNNNIFDGHLIFRAKAEVIVIYASIGAGAEAEAAALSAGIGS